MKEETLARMFLNRIAEGGDAVRFRYIGPSGVAAMTYREVGAAVREIACGLMDLGISRGDKVAILSATRVEWSLADIACVLGGFVTVPIYPTNTPEQIAYVLEHSGARAIFVEDDAQARKVSEIRGQVPSVGAVFLMTGKGPGGGSGESSLAELRARGRTHAGMDPGAVERRADEIGPEDELTIIYTSGTTGPPKGSVVLHRNYATNVTATLKAVSIRKDDVILHFLPFAHVLGRLEHFLSFDAMMVSFFARSVATVAEDLPVARPHVMVSVPRLYEKIYAGIRAKVAEEGGAKASIFAWALGVGSEVSRLRQAGKRPGGFLAARFALADLLVFGKIRARLGGRLRFFVSGGAPLSREIAEFFHCLGILILEGYGMTETPTVTSCNREDDYRFGTVGKPLDGIEVRIAEDGEILVRGSHVFKGYFKDPAATREAIDDDGWFHTGDVGELTPDGFLRITDRKKDIIVTSGGKNIAPQNIENLLKSDPLVSQAFVHGDRRKYLTAILTLSAEHAAKWAEGNGIAERDPEALARDERLRGRIRETVDAVNATLPPHEQVRKYALLGRDFAMDTGELTPTLKVRRKIVMEKYGGLLDALYEED